MLEHLVNEDLRKAEEPFLDIVVENPKRFMKILAEETKDEEVDEASRTMK